MYQVIRIVIIVLISSTTTFSQVTDFSLAKEIATEKDNNIIMVFSGSDWCKPCIQFKKEIINSSTFHIYQEEHLVYLEVDFPYRKENMLSPEQQEHNESLAEQFNEEGKFPKVILLDKNGNVIKELSYKKGVSPKQFIDSITTNT